MRCRFRLLVPDNFGSQEADIVADIGGESGKKDKPTNVFMGPVRKQMQVPVHTLEFSC